MQKGEEEPEYSPTPHEVHVSDEDVENVEAAHGVHAIVSSDVAASTRCFPSEHAVQEGIPLPAYSPVPQEEHESDETVENVAAAHSTQATDSSPVASFARYFPALHTEQAVLALGEYSPVWHGKQLDSSTETESEGLNFPAGHTSQLPASFPKPGLYPPGQEKKKQSEKKCSSVLGGGNMSMVFPCVGVFAE